MMIVGGLFCLVFAWLLIINRKTQTVKQFNIVYAAEQPSLPETTQYSYNFFAHYRKAIGFLAMPLVTNFWDALSDTLHTTSDLIRKIYSGNGQTYALHIIIYITIFYFFTVGS